MRVLVACEHGRPMGSAPNFAPTVTQRRDNQTPPTTNEAERMKTTRVILKNGKRSTLHTDDTLTLAFPGMVESTPATLAGIVSARSLAQIAETSDDSNETAKAHRALAMADKHTDQPSPQPPIDHTERKILAELCEHGDGTAQYPDL